MNFGDLLVLWLKKHFAARNASSDEVSLLVNLVSLRSERLIYIRNVSA